MGQPMPIKTPQPPKPRRGQWFYDWASPFAEWARTTRAVPGIGMRGRMTGDGLAFDIEPQETAQHPFRINAEFNAATPTAVLCTVTFGQIGSFTPLFPGLSGDPLSDTPAPVHTIALTADVYYFSLVATVTKDGVLSGAYIDVDTTAPTNTNPVPDDMPTEGATGTAGEYVFPLGEVEIVDNGGGSYSFYVRQTIRHSLTFKFCDNVAGIMAV